MIQLSSLLYSLVSRIDEVIHFGASVEHHDIIDDTRALTIRESLTGYFFVHLNPSKLRCAHFSYPLNGGGTRAPNTICVCLVIESEYLIWIFASQLAIICLRTNQRWPGTAVNRKEEKIQVGELVLLNFAKVLKLFGIVTSARVVCRHGRVATRLRERFRSLCNKPTQNLSFT